MTTLFLMARPLMRTSLTESYRLLERRMTVHKICMPFLALSRNLPLRQGPPPGLLDF